MGALNHEQIRERLADGEIFDYPTWDEEQLRPAGYDLRISPTILARNNEAFEHGEDVGKLLVLHPGDAAYVQSVEHFCIPWDLAANLGLRFRYARKGLSVLTGLLVDPGFGLEPNGDDWTSIGAPLKFFLVNVGKQEIEIEVGPKGDGVLSMQFLEVSEVQEKEETKPQREVRPSAALWAFQNPQQIREELELETAETEKRFVALEQQVKKLAGKVATTESATSNIVVFGVFLLAISLAGVVTTLLLEYLAADSFGALVRNFDHLELHGFDATLVAVAAFSVVVAPVLGLLYVFVRGLRAVLDTVLRGTR